MAKILNNIKSNWEKTRADPYINLKMNYRATKYLVILVGGLVAINIITAIINIRDYTPMSLLVRAAMVLVGLFIIQRMYFGVLNPLKKNLDHYEANPKTITSRFIDVEKEIDDLLEEFDNKEKKIQNDKSL